MKKYLSLLITAALLLTGCMLTAMPVSATELVLIDGHYEITTAEEFMLIPQKIYGEYWIMNDIDLTSQSVSTAYIINWINGGKILGRASDGTPKNVVITTNKVLFNQSDNGRIENITVAGTVSGAGASRQAALVLMAGTGTVIDSCINRADVTGTGNNVGGLIGNVHSGDLTVTNCRNEGTVTTSGNYAGGIAGLVKNSTVISGCVNTGSINATGRSGGIVGVLMGSSSVENCSNEGTVSVTGNYAGGISGDSTGSTDIKISGCSNKGTVTANSHSAGIIAYVDTNVKINKCYNAGTVTGITSYSGGIASFFNASEISDCYNAGKIKSTKSASTLGGIIAYVGGTNVTLTRCYNASAGVTDAFFPSTSAASVLTDCYYLANSRHYDEKGTKLNPREATDITRFLNFADNGWNTTENEYGYIFPKLTDNPHSAAYDMSDVKLAPPSINYVGRLSDGRIIAFLSDFNPSTEIKNYKLIFRTNDNISGITYEFNGKMPDITAQIEEGVTYTLTAIASSDTWFDSDESEALTVEASGIQDYYKLSVSAVGEGSVDFSGVKYITADENIDITAVPSEGKILEYMICNSKIIPLNLTEEYVYRVPAKNDVSVTLVFSEVTTGPSVYSYNEAYTEKTGEVNSAYVFAKLSEADGYTVSDFGVLLSDESVTAEEFVKEKEGLLNAKGKLTPNIVGQFGIKFTGKALIPGTYYARAYGEYTAESGSTTVYGDIITFVIE